MRIDVETEVVGGGEIGYLLLEFRLRDGIPFFARPVGIGEIAEKAGGGVRHGRHDETARPAGTVENLLARLRIEHGDDHVHDVAGREVGAATPARGGADNLLVGFAFHVDVGSQKAVALKFGDDVRERPRLERNFVGRAEDAAIFRKPLDAGENCLDALFHGELAVGIPAFGARRVEFKRFRDVALVLDLAENHLEELEERFLLLQPVRDMDVIVAGSEDEKKIVVRCVAQFRAFGAIHVGERPVGRRNVDELLERPSA